MDGERRRSRGRPAPPRCRQWHLGHWPRSPVERGLFLWFRRTSQNQLISERVQLFGVFEVFNLFNHANYGSYTTNENNANYGKPSFNSNLAYQPRMLQLGFRTTF